jgi:hypothetical protein
VHNAAPALLSISAQNRLPCNAIAAGWDTVPMSLVESSAQLACGAERVLLVLADERVPHSLSAEHRHGPLAAAFVLTRTQEAGARGILRNLRRAKGAELDGRPDPFDGGNHPLGSSLFIARALHERSQESVRLGDGTGPWCVDVDARVQP